MSADNYLLITKKTFEVFNGCASNDYLQKIGQGKDLKDAIRIAEEYEEELWNEGSYLEYGIHFSLDTRGFYVVRKKNRN